MPANENTRKNRLAFGAEIVSYDDARRAAKRRLPRMIYDFIDGAAGRETAPASNRAGFDAVNLQPRALRNVTERCLETHLLGQVFDAPFGIAPMGMCGLTYPGADQIMADQCTARNIPLGLSTAASIPLENMRQLAGDNAWFQLYASGSTEQTMSFVERAKQAGYQKLILTVDVPQVSRRVRDHKNGFEVPFRIGPKQFLDFALHPQWSLSMLWHGIPETANYKHPNSGGFDRNSSRAGADWAFLDQLRQVWSGELIIKGVTSTEGAQHIQAAGADAIWVSNHGGRQLDSAPPSVALLPPIRTAVGPNYPVIFDSGVRHGEDIIKALALGADFVMLGRPVMFALGAAGGRGLTAYLDEVTLEISTAMAQIGICSVPDITPQCLYGHTQISPAPITENIALIPTEHHKTGGHR